MCVIIEVLVYLVCGTTSLSNWFWRFETLWSSKDIMHQSVTWCYIPQEWRPTLRAPQKPKNLYALFCGLVKWYSSIWPQISGASAPIFLLYIMNSAVRLHSFKNIQLFLTSPVSLFKLNMYNIFAFPSLGSEIQVSWHRSPYTLIVTFQKSLLPPCQHQD